MDTLEERLREVMDAMGWDRTDVMRVSQQSSSVVSQWLGNASKTIKTIGKLEAAIYLERATGFSALWIAKGMGPKRAHPTAQRTSEPVRLHHVGEPSNGYTAQHPATIEQALDCLENALSQAPEGSREIVATNLAGWVRDGTRGPWRQVVQHLLTDLSGKQRRAG